MGTAIYNSSTAVSLVLLALQLGLIAFTVWFIPRKLALHKHGATKFILLSMGLWLGYTVLSTLADSWLGGDVPGVGYIVVGFVCTVLGLGVFLFKSDSISKKK